MLIKDKKAIEAMQEGGRILGSILSEVSLGLEAGMDVSEIDSTTNKLCSKYGVEPAFKDYKPSPSAEPYPASICVSINDEIVHGIPSGKILKDKDIVTLDFGVLYKGYITDSAVTVAIGDISNEDKDLMRVAEESLYKGIKAVKEGARVGDISEAIQRHVEGRGFNVFKSLAGHGVGKELHEEPTIPNYGIRGIGMELRSGMTLAIETMVTKGRGGIEIAEDGWTMKTTDGLHAAQFEHTVLVTAKGCEILTKP